MLRRPAVPGPFLPRCPAAASGWRAAALVVLTLAGALSFAETPAAPPAPAPATPVAAPALPAASPARPASKAASARNGRRVTTPLWSELSAAEQQSLAPLAGAWNALSPAQKRKWQAMAQNFPKLSADEQAKLHSRMTEWAALSPQQRTRARLNFGTTKQLSADEKKAKWEAYQALPPEEKRKLAASAAKSPVTAAAVRPVPQGKLAKVPKPRSPASRPAAATAPRAAASAPAAAPASAPGRAG